VKVDLLNADLVDGFDAVADVSNGTVLLKGRMTSGREQFIAADAGTRPIVKLDNIVQVNAIRDNLNDFVCELSLVNLDPAKTYAFFRQVFPSTAAGAFIDGTLAPAATNLGPSTSTGVQVRWQAWVPGPNDASARVIVVEAGLRKPNANTCDYFATVFVGGD
jgi:hypothetical protein